MLPLAMGGKSSSQKDTRGDIATRGDLVGRIQVLERNGDTLKFQYARARRGSRESSGTRADYFDTVIVFQGGKRHHSSEFYDDSDFLYYSIFRCLECWTAAPRIGRQGSVDSARKPIAKTNSSSPRLGKDNTPRVEESSRSDGSPHIVRISSQGDILREVRPIKTHARIMESRIAVREYVDDTKYESPNKGEILNTVKQLVADLVIGGDVPVFMMKVSAYETGLYASQQFPYYINFRSNAYSSLSAQLLYHLQWYKHIINVSPVLDIRLSLVDLIGVCPDTGPSYAPLEPRFATEDTNAPSWYRNGLLNLHPELLKDLFTLETVLLCLSPAARSDLVFPEGTVICKDTSQNLEKILSGNPILKSRIEALRKA